VGTVPAVALSIAALAALGFALSSSLQHHANTAVRHAVGTTNVLGLLIRRPGWVLGQTIALLSFSLHAVALRLGALVLVQPVVVSGIVLAVPARAVLARRRPRWGEWGTVTMTAGGLAVFLVAVDPRHSHLAAPAVAVSLTAIGALLAGVAALWAGRRHGVPRATGYGLACGILFGLTGGLVKLAAADLGASDGFAGHLWALVTGWPTWAVLVAGLSAMVLNQRAYRAAPLSVSMPLLNIVDVLVAIGFGVAVFGEVPAHTAPALACQAFAIVLMAMGLRRLARSQALEDDRPPRVLALPPR
jgi:hypothetical protein